MNIIYSFVWKRQENMSDIVSVHWQQGKFQLHGWPSTQPGTCTQPCPIVHTAVPPLFTQPCPGRTMSTAVCIYVAGLCANCPAVYTRELCANCFMSWRPVSNAGLGISKTPSATNWCVQRPKYSVMSRTGTSFNTRIHIYEVSIPPYRDIRTEI